MIDGNALGIADVRDGHQETTSCVKHREVLKGCKLPSGLIIYYPIPIELVISITAIPKYKIQWSTDLVETPDE